MSKDIKYLSKRRRTQIIYQDIHNNSLHSNPVVKEEKLPVQSQFENNEGSTYSQENTAIFNEISNCNSQLNLQEDLQKLIIEHNISHITSNELLRILRKHGYTELPSEVDVIKYCTSLESTTNSAAGANYHTMDENRLNHRKRQPTLSNQYSSEEEENDNYPSRLSERDAVNSMSTLVSTLPSGSNNVYNINNNNNNNDNNNDKNINENNARNEIAPAQSYCQKRSNYSKQPQKIQLKEIHDIPVIYKDLASSSDEMQMDSNIKKYLKQIIRTQAASDLILQDINQRISRIEDIMKSHAPVSVKNSSQTQEDVMKNHAPASIRNDSPVAETLPLQTVENIRNDSLIVEILPLQTVKNIKDFDLLLRDNDEAITQFKVFLLKIGGNNPRRNVCRILSKIFTNNCAMSCSWKGIRNNFKVSNLYFIKIMKRELTLHHPTLTEAEFDNIVAEWLRFAKQRKQREERGKDAGHEHIEEINLLKVSTT